MKATDEPDTPLAQIKCCSNLSDDGQARRDANTFVRRYPDKGIKDLLPLYNYEQFIKRFGRVEEFDETLKEYKSWTFWTYARKAVHVLDDLGKPIERQLRRHRKIIRAKLERELARAVARRDGSA